MFKVICKIWGKGHTKAWIIGVNTGYQMAFEKGKNHKTIFKKLSGLWGEGHRDLLPDYFLSSLFYV
jgi:hypothetical protein